MATTTSGDGEAPVDPRLARLAKVDPSRAAEVEACHRASTSNAPPPPPPPPPFHAPWALPPGSTATKPAQRRKKKRSSIQPVPVSVANQQQSDLTCTWCHKLKSKRVWFAKNQWNQDKPLCRDCLTRREKEYDDFRFDRELDVDNPGESAQDRLDASLARAKRDKAVSRGITDEGGIAGIRLSKAEVRAAEDAVHNAAPLSVSAYFDDNTGGDDAFDYDDE